MKSLAQDLGGVVQLLEKATPGEWTVGRFGSVHRPKVEGSESSVGSAIVVGGSKSGMYDGYQENCEAIAAAVNFLRTHSAEIAGALAAEVRCGEWVLVPRCITGPAADYLAGFDMDSIGNNRGDAASECWAGLVDMLGREPPELKFSNPVFHAGTNLTVRRGTKWYREELAVVMVEGVKVTVRLSCMTHKFSRLTDHWIRDEHDPSCRTVAGLLAEMQRVYPGFNEHEEVTLVRFDLPAAMQQGGGVTEHASDCRIHEDGSVCDCGVLAMPLG